MAGRGGARSSGKPFQKSVDPAAVSLDSDHFRHNLLRGGIADSAPCQDDLRILLELGLTHWITSGSRTLAPCGTARECMTRADVWT